MLYVEEKPFIPLTTPSCPTPGPDFLTLAAHFKDDSNFKSKNGKKILAECGAELEELYRRALYDNQFHLNVSVKNSFVSTPCLPGHIWGQQTGLWGPEAADVMVITKCPQYKEMQTKSYVQGDFGNLLAGILEEIGISEEEYVNWYITSVVKHPSVDPASQRLAASWIKNWLPVLYQEINLVRPKLIICLGSEAANAVLQAKINVKESAGMTFDLNLEEIDERGPAVAKVVACTNPAAIFHSPDQKVFVLDGLRNVPNLLSGGEIVANNPQATHDYRYVYTADELREVVDMILARCGNRPIFVFDSEWHGQSELDENAYLRTVQFTDKAKFAVCVVLREQGGGQAFFPSTQAAANELKRLVRPSATYKPRIAGHHLRADLPWIIRKLDAELGSLLLEGFKPAATPELARVEGGIDTMMIAHSIRETGFNEKFKLEYVCQYLLGVPRWNIELEKWKKKYCKDNKIKQKDLDGYGECPDDVLHPYACSDVAYPREMIDIAIQPGGLLDKDEFGNSSWRAFHSSMLSAHAFLEMEMTGVYVDMDMAKELTQIYQAASAKLLAEIREETNWPEFNAGSPFDARELLYGENFHRRKTPGKYRPDGALSLYLPPIKTSTKPPIDWQKIPDNEQDLYSPSTDKETLGILSVMYPEYELIDKLRKQRFLSQVLKFTLKPPTSSESSDDSGEDDSYEDGLLSFVQNDSRIHTSLFPTQETGRTSSARPNLQNVSKRREEDYKKCLGDHYKYPLRGIFTSTPGGFNGIPTVLVEFDLQGAELKVMAVQSGDPVMLDHTERNKLAEDDPNFVDIHSTIAVSAFKLNCPPTKAGLASIGKKGLRDVAKTIVFGVAYGRGDEAVVRGCKEMNVITTRDEVATLRSTIFSLYKNLGPYLSGAQKRAGDPGWVSNCYGRLRRFPDTNNHEVLAKFMRESGNFVVQSGVADFVHRWMHRLYTYEGRIDNKGNPRYKMLLQIHDAIMVECRVDSLLWFKNEVLPNTLANLPMYRCDFDGRKRKPETPYYMGCDFSVYKRWGVKFTEEDAIELGVPLEAL